MEEIDIIRWKQILICMLLSMLLGWLNKYFKVITVDYNVKYMIDASMIFMCIMFLLSMFDFHYNKYWYPKNEWKVLIQKNRKKQKEINNYDYK